MDTTQLNERLERATRALQDLAAGVDVGPETLLRLLNFSHSQGHTLTGGTESLDAAAILVAAERSMADANKVLCHTLLQAAERILGLTARRARLLPAGKCRIERGTWAKKEVAA